MAKDKKSVLIYCDLIHTVKHLPDELAGRLFKHLLAYVNDEDPQTDDVILKIAFEPIKQQLKRDLQKYNNIFERNKINEAMQEKLNAIIHAQYGSGSLAQLNNRVSEARDFLDGII